MQRDILLSAIQIHQRSMKLLRVSVPGRELKWMESIHLSLFPMRSELTNKLALKVNGQAEMNRGLFLAAEGPAVDNFGGTRSYAVLTSDSRKVVFK